MKTRLTTCATVICTFAALKLAMLQAVVADEFLVAEWGANTITKIVDLNGDGDALDLNEQSLWADATNAPRAISYGDNALFVVDAGTEVLRFEDLNLDGDALDTGEWGVFADGLNAPSSVLFLEPGHLVLSESLTDEIWQFMDLNGDGDALDTGERTLFADTIDGANDIVSFQDGLLVSTNVSNEVFHLRDINGDDDALDTGEAIVIADSIARIIGGARGLHQDGQGGFLVTSGPDQAISHAQDLNLDGDMLDVAEFVTYADSFFNTLDAPGSLVGFAGAMLATDSNLGTIVKVADSNGDGDALDLTETSLFADGLLNPTDIAAVISTAPPLLPGDFDLDKDVDGADFLLWQRGGSPNPNSSSDLADWEANYGAVATLSATSASVPEPATCLMLAFAVITILPLHSRRRIDRARPHSPDKPQTSVHFS